MFYCNKTLLKYIIIIILDLLTSAIVICVNNQNLPDKSRLVHNKNNILLKSF